MAIRESRQNALSIRLWLDDVVKQSESGRVTRRPFQLASNGVIRLIDRQGRACEAATNDAIRWADRVIGAIPNPYRGGEDCGTPRYTLIAEMKSQPFLHASFRPDRSALWPLQRRITI